jgi:hypothetical protein
MIDSIQTKRETKKDVAIDSNVFRNKEFLAFILWRKDKINLKILPIVFLEFGHYFMAFGNNWEQLLHYFEKFNAELLKWNEIDSKTILEKSVQMKNELPLKHHFRDFLIGTQCEKKNFDLITYNVKHFSWIKTIQIYTPDEFVAKIG